MGVVYSGRYKRISGVKNSAFIPPTVPPLAANETTWLEKPFYGVISKAGNHMAVPTASRTYSLNTTQIGPVQTFIYALNDDSVPSVLIAEIPNADRGAPMFSPDGRYLTMFRSERPGVGAITYDLLFMDCYEVLADSIVPKGVRVPASLEQFKWFEDSDHYAYLSYEPNNVFDQQVFISSISNPLVNFNTNGARLVTMLSGYDFIVDPGYSGQYVVLRYNPANNTCSTIATMSGPILSKLNQQGGAVLGYIGEGYLVKDYWVVAADSAPGALPGENGYRSEFKQDLYAYLGDGSFVNLGSVPAPYISRENAQLASNGDIISSFKNSGPNPNFGNEYLTNFPAETGGIIQHRIGSTIQTIPCDPITGSSTNSMKSVIFNKGKNRVVVVEDSGVRSYPRATNGFKLPPAPVEPRFFFDFNANVLPTRALYPITVNVTGSPTVKVINGIPCVEFETGDNMEFNSLNYFDFGCESGFVHFWFRWEKLYQNQNYFRFGPHVFRSSQTLASANSLDMFGNARRYKWSHALLAWDRQYTTSFMNGLDGGGLIYSRHPDLKNPVKLFNNTTIEIGGGENVMQFRDLSFHKGNIDPIMFGQQEAAFKPPKWEYFRENQAWPHLPDAQFLSQHTRVFTPKFS